jgi:hypothetical protein
MEPMSLPGLERLLDVCQRLNLGLMTSPPAREPLRAGSLLEGLPLDPLLASVYARLGQVVFASKLMGLSLIQSNDDEQRLEANNKLWRENHWDALGMPVIVFAGEVYTYATVPSLADEWGRQPVVEVNTYELDGLHVLPVASNVDRFFDSYSRYLEAVVASPRYQEAGENGILFPTHMGDLLARDERLVELLRSGRFEPLMKNLDEGERRWVAKVMGARE